MFDIEKRLGEALVFVCVPVRAFSFGYGFHIGYLGVKLIVARVHYFAEVA